LPYPDFVLLFNITLTTASCSRFWEY